MTEINIQLIRSLDETVRRTREQRTAIAPPSIERPAPSLMTRLLWNATRAARRASLRLLALAGELDRELEAGDEPSPELITRLHDAAVEARNTAARLAELRRTTREER